jgi:hypothetical protein
MPLAALTPLHTRRRLVGRALLLPCSPLLALAGCAAAWPPVPPGAGSSSALRHLQDSAATQGLAAYRSLGDVNLSLAGSGWWLADESAVEAAAVGGAQLRLLPATGLLAMHLGSGAGQRQWLRTPGRAVPAAADRLWQGGRPVDDGAAKRRAAVTADLQRLLLLGPIDVAAQADVVHWAEPQTLDGRRCDHLQLALRPGLGGADSDRLSLFIDRDEGLLRRLRVSLAGWGADDLEVDLGGHRRLHGITWPTLWSSPAPGWLPGRPPRRWRLTGLDVNRGYGAADLDLAPWRGNAAAPAAPLPPG